ncbi:SUMF1/EgtB/PvdO family nonheme iron enzyme [Aestuariibacter sp. AA17]|uniref:SUMF1/EgtB/PvdO family nonheme iron enzyme n=1 Tax=Fluctibacter corallii TaxID=2984329 RepID=A0ABT3A725_9ALTE|nr:SUMF1/EgtB/PvdO family nonheme iron enzyme [Aestuariibacter sp. AA17]MCV2884489.1 SUMF1/EgtB/PvdO family nonheme iron enzyme [Aestuariibacter sp. AA17]
MKIKTQTHVAAIFLCSVISTAYANPNYIEPPMVLIPKGTFLMGSEHGRANERPVHQVDIAPFMMGKYEVTLKEYGKFVKATKHTPKNESANKCMRFNKKNSEGIGPPITLEEGNWDTPEYAPSAFHPVLCVSTDDAKAYAVWLSAQTGKRYRLPTEAEWEYAARANSTTTYFYGDSKTQLCEYGNVYDQRGKAYIERHFNQAGTYAPCDDGSEFTAVVGTYKANAFGLYDTIGNVSELTADCEHHTYDGAPQNGTAWITDCDLFREQNIMQIHRGGSYGLWSPPSRITSASRHHVGTDLRTSLGNGFRLALDFDHATALHTIDTEFEKDLKAAQAAALTARQRLPKFPSPPTNAFLIEDKETDAIQLRWQTNESQIGTTFNIYRSHTIGGEMEKIASNIIKHTYTDHSPKNRRHKYQIAAVVNQQESLLSQSVYSSDVIKTIPATIQAEDFNNMHNASIGEVTHKETNQPSLTLTGSNGIMKYSWTEYKIQVPKGGRFQLHYNIASASGSKGFNLIMNSLEKGTFSIPNTGGWRKWKTVVSDAIQLHQGEHTIRILAIDNQWKLDWFAFEKVDSELAVK